MARLYSAPVYCAALPGKRAPATSARWCRQRPVRRGCGGAARRL